MHKGEQIEMDRAMAAEYEDQHNNEIALRGEGESDQGESDGTQYDAFGRLSPLQFPSSLPPSPLQFPSVIATIFIAISFIIATFSITKSIATTT